MRTAFVSAVAALASLTPALAAACPYCAGQAGGGPGRSIALGAFILLPFLVVGVILKVIRAEAALGQKAISTPDARAAPARATIAERQSRSPSRDESGRVAE